MCLVGRYIKSQCRSRSSTLVCDMFAVNALVYPVHWKAPQSLVNWRPVQCSHSSQHPQVLPGSAASHLLVLWFWNIPDACGSNISLVHTTSVAFCDVGSFILLALDRQPFSTSVPPCAGSTQVVRFGVEPGLLHGCCSFASRFVAFGYVSSVPLLTASCLLVGL